MSAAVREAAVRRPAALSVGLLLALGVLGVLAHPVGAQTAPTAPTVTTNASATTSGAIEVTWTEVTDALGYLVTPQQLRADGQWVAVEGRTQRFTGRRPVIFDGLVNGSAYRGCVAAFLSDAFVIGLSSGAVPYGLPGLPAVTSVDRQGGTVTVSWSPAAGNGRQVSSYEVSVAPNDVDPVVVSGNETSAELSGLRDGVDYAVSVRASNLRGRGEAGQGQAVSNVAAVPSFAAPRVIMVAVNAGPCAGAVTTSSTPAPSQGSSDPAPVDEAEEATAAPAAPRRTAPPASSNEAEDDAPEPTPAPVVPAQPVQPSAPPAEADAPTPAPPEIAATGRADGMSGTTMWVALLGLAGLVIGSVVVQQRMGRRVREEDAG